MVKSFYLSSLREGAGKSFLSIGFIQKLIKEGKKFAYFKPIGNPQSAFTNKADPDVAFILKTIYHKIIHIPQDYPYDFISPVSVPESYYVDLVNANRREQFLQKIKSTYDKITKDIEYIIIEGNPSIRKYIRVGLDDVSIAKVLGINEMIYISIDSSDRCIDNLIFTKNYFDSWNIGIKGVLFNNIEYDYIARIKELTEEHINKYDIPVIGIIEKSIELFSPRVSEIIEQIGGELINEKASSGLNNIVENYLIGAMNSQAALKYLRQVNRAAFITGGDRTDLAMAALDQDVSALILTGFMQPDMSVITVANDKGIPIILSPSDTYTTMRNLERLKPSIQEDEIEKVLELVEKELNWDLLLK
ncbi:MAG: phosphotransacetylase family protein [Promethearchaeota archaeon]|nr:MAG: phosphotransacetylase family protein [Candidatus Lokiarchaeota archaeon]